MKIKIFRDLSKTLLNLLFITISFPTISQITSETKNTNLRDHFFSYLVPVIHCQIISINAEEAVVSINLNGVNQEITCGITITENIFNLKGTIPNLSEFGTSDALEALNMVCGVYHEGFIWPDIDIELSISNFEKL